MMNQQFSTSERQLPEPLLVYQSFQFEGPGPIYAEPREAVEALIEHHQAATNIRLASTATLHGLLDRRGGNRSLAIRIARSLGYRRLATGGPARCGIRATHRLLGHVDDLESLGIPRGRGERGFL